MTVLTNATVAQPGAAPYPPIDPATPVAKGTFAHTSPYGGCWLEHFYRRGSRDLYGSKIKSEVHFRQLAAQARALPELWIEGNFVVERHAVRSLCRELGINQVSSEDGFFPHYQTLHADPLGFSWESSLCRTVFDTCRPHQRERAHAARRSWMEFAPQELPNCVRPPFVLWPLQLVGDKVNRWDLSLESWTELIVHFRKCLPDDYQLVIKHHPRSKPSDYVGIPEMVKELPNCCLVDRAVDLKTLLSGASAVAGVNSTVLAEARLMFLKPVYAYGRSWFTAHTDLVMPLSHRFEDRLPPRFEFVAAPGTPWGERLGDYADWFLYQLLVRQMTHKTAEDDWDALHEFASKFSYQSYLRYGDELFV